MHFMMSSRTIHIYYQYHIIEVKLMDVVRALKIELTYLTSRFHFSSQNIG